MFRRFVAISMAVVTITLYGNRSRWLQAAGGPDTDIVGAAGKRALGANGDPLQQTLG